MKNVVLDAPYWDSAAAENDNIYPMRINKYDLGLSIAYQIV
jgi:hypothetical protein